MIIIKKEKYPSTPRLNGTVDRLMKISYVCAVSDPVSYVINN